MHLVCQDSGRYLDPVNRQAAIAALRQRFTPPASDGGSRSLLEGMAGDQHGSFPRQALTRGTLHELLSIQNPAHTLLMHLARAIVTGDEQSRPLLWIGECTWPYLPRLSGLPLCRSVFVRPANIGERLWAIDLGLRSQCVSGIIADGSGLDLASTRRLFLSAQSTAVTCLLARPAHESRIPTAASTRWRITPSPSPHHTQRWQIELLRCKNTFAALTDRGWIIEETHAPGSQTSTLRVVADLCDRSGMATTAARQIAHMQ